MATNRRNVLMVVVGSALTLAAVVALANLGSAWDQTPAAAMPPTGATIDDSPLPSMPSIRPADPSSAAVEPPGLVPLPQRSLGDWHPRTVRPGGVPENSGASVGEPSPPEGFRAAVGWMQAVQDPRGVGDSWVEIDWLRLHAVVDGESRLIAADEYAEEQVCGGLYVRYPWFAGNEETPMRREFSHGALVLRPSEHPDKVYHWWNCRRAALPPDTASVWIEARVRIHGPAAVQAGIDYWRDLGVQYGGYNVNNREGGSSAWFFADDGWQVITAAKPSE